MKIVMRFSGKTRYVLAAFFVLMGIASVEVQAFQSNRHIGVVRRFKPDVTVSNFDLEKYIEFELSENIGEKLFTGDSLSTDEEGFALVLFMDRSVAKVKPNSILIINGEVGVTNKQSNTRIDLEQGEIFLNVEPQGANDFEVATSRSLASVKGTDFGSKSDGYVWVENGQVDVTALNSGQTISLFEKMFAQVDEEGNNIDSGTLSDEELNELNTGYDEMDNDLIRKEVVLKFIDQNGQIREITIEVFEEGQE
ncbi:FecR domain-containing protein [Gracilimonas sp.]|uniref:FecR domain-containing protein n=1 Tax=Gracilimonas sp. TaxID=1974203 RepID=UPI003751DBEF